MRHPSVYSSDSRTVDMEVESAGFECLEKSFMVAEPDDPLIPKV